MSIRRLRARLERLAPPAAPTIGEDPARDRQRRHQLSCRKMTPRVVWTAQEEAKLSALNTFFNEEDHAQLRFGELRRKSSRTESEQRELEELKRRFPPDPNDPLNAAYKAWGEGL